MSQNDQLTDAEEVFKDALDDFRSHLSPRQLESFPGTNLDGVKREILVIQTTQDRLKTMMAFRRVEMFIDSFKQFDRVCQALRTRVDGLSGFIWGPTRYILQIAKEDSGVLDSILERYQRLGREIPQLDRYEKLVGERPLMANCLAYMYQDLLRFHKDILRLFREKNWKKTIQANLRDYEKAFETIREGFVRHQRLLKDEMASYQFQVTQNSLSRMDVHFVRYHHDQDDSHRHMQQYRQDREALFRLARDAEEKRKDDQRLAIIRWLAGPDELQKEYHRKFGEIRKEFSNTCTWVLELEMMWNWTNIAVPPAHSMLWLNGKRGAGKSVLASLIIDHCAEIKSFKTSYFYCRENDPNQNTCLSICKGLLRQLVRHTEDLLPSCYEKRQRGDDVLNDLTTAKSLIELFCDLSMEQFIIIDGLDECDDPRERKAVLQLLKDLVDKSDGYGPGKIRVLIISQDFSDIRKAMQSASILDIPQEMIQKDISRFARTQAKKVKAKFELTEQDIELVEGLTARRANGMFQFAFLAVENLLKQPNTGRFRVELRENCFPANLGDAYGKTIKRLRGELSDNQWAEAKKIFGWLACAKRPLRWHELQAVLSMQDEPGGQVTFDFHNRQLRDDIRDICGPLVHVIGSRIEFAHQTAREYVIKHQDLDEQGVECDLAILCFRYLSLDCFRRDATEEERRDYAKKGHYAFQDYAISKWKHHLETMIENTASLFSQGDRGWNYGIRVSAALGTFIQTYRGGLEMGLESEQSQQQDEQPGEQETALAESTRAFCQAFQHLPFYDDLLFLWTHVSKHQNRDFKSRNRVSIKELGEALVKIRSTLENLYTSKSPRSSSATATETLTRRYGANFFKCERVTCDYFYEGFPARAALDSHSTRHDRPFQCPVRGCTFVRFGFLSNKDRDRHIRAYHPDEAEGPAPFAQLGGRRAVVDETKHKCDLCGKNFTRRANLRAHKNSHFGVRDFACSTCDKAFTRANDRRRHERTVHVRRARGGG